MGFPRSSSSEMVRSCAASLSTLFMLNDGDRAGADSNANDVPVLRVGEGSDEEVYLGE